MNKLELKVPPAVIWSLVAFAMWMPAKASKFGPASTTFFAVAVGLVLAGVLIAVLGVVSFRRARTTVDPRYPQNASALVTSGIYGVTRNPMYLGMLVALAGWACWLGQPVPFLFLPLFGVILNRVQILPEERALSRMFGAEFNAYCARVRRWI